MEIHATLLSYAIPHIQILLEFLLAKMREYIRNYLVFPHGIVDSIDGTLDILFVSDDNISISDGMRLIFGYLRLFICDIVPAFLSVFIAYTSFFTPLTMMLLATHYICLI